MSLLPVFILLDQSQYSLQQVWLSRLFLAGRLVWATASPQLLRVLLRLLRLLLRLHALEVLSKESARVMALARKRSTAGPESGNLENG